MAHDFRTNEEELSRAMLFIQRLRTSGNPLIRGFMMREAQQRMEASRSFRRRLELQEQITNEERSRERLRLRDNRGTRFGIIAK